MRAFLIIAALLLQEMVHALVASTKSASSPTISTPSTASANSTLALVDGETLVSEHNTTSRSLKKRGAPGSVYICWTANFNPEGEPQYGWTGSPCTYYPAETWPLGTCNTIANMEGIPNEVFSFGPDQGAICTVYNKPDCDIEKPVVTDHSGMSYDYEWPGTGDGTIGVLEGFDLQSYMCVPN